MALKVADIEQALITCRGNITATAESLGVSRMTIHRRINQHPSLAEIKEQLTETRIDRAEAKLDEAVDRGEAWAVALMLKTLGRHRGYVERSEQAHSGDVKVEWVRVNHSPED